VGVGAVSSDSGSVTATIDGANGVSAEIPITVR
jgi:hypothetical protein